MRPTCAVHLCVGGVGEVEPGRVLVGRDGPEAGADHHGHCRQSRNIWAAAAAAERPLPGSPTWVELQLRLRLRRGEQLHHDWLLAAAVLQSEPAVLQKPRPLTI